MATNRIEVEISEGKCLGIIAGDITKLDVEAIVCTANTTLADLRIGPSIFAQLNSITEGKLSSDLYSLSPAGGPSVGDVYCTKAHNLPARYIITVVVHSFNRPKPSEKNIECFVREIIREAASKGIESIVLPIIGTGVIGCRPEDIGKRMIHFMLEAMEDYSSSKVYLCVMDIELQSYLSDQLKRLNKRREKTSYCSPKNLGTEKDKCVNIPSQRFTDKHGSVAPVARAKNCFKWNLFRKTRNYEAIKKRLDDFLSFNLCLLLSEYMYIDECVPINCKLDNDIAEFFTSKRLNTLGGKCNICFKLSKHIRKNSCVKNSVAQFWATTKYKYSKSKILLDEIIGIRNKYEHGRGRIDRKTVRLVKDKFREVLDKFEDVIDILLLKVDSIQESGPNGIHTIEAIYLHKCERDYKSDKEFVKGVVAADKLYAFRNHQQKYLENGLCLWPFLICNSKSEMDCIYYLESIDITSGKLNYFASDISAKDQDDRDDLLSALPKKLHLLMKNPC